MQQDIWTPCVRLIEVEKNEGTFDIEVPLDFILSTDADTAQKQIDKFLEDDDNWVIGVDEIVQKSVVGSSFSYGTNGWDYADVDTIYLMGTFTFVG